MPEVEGATEASSNSLISQARGGCWEGRLPLRSNSEGVSCRDFTRSYISDSTFSVSITFSWLASDFKRPERLSSCGSIFLLLISSYSHFFFFPKRNFVDSGIKIHFPFSILNKCLVLVLPVPVVRLPLCSPSPIPSILHEVHSIFLLRTR